MIDLKIWHKKKKIRKLIIFQYVRYLCKKNELIFIIVHLYVYIINDTYH